MTEAERQQKIELARYNVFNLDGADVEVDLSSDVPVRSTVGDVNAVGERFAREGGRHPALATSATALYGPARYVTFTRGRAAEMALAAAMVKKGDVIVTPSSFKSTQTAFKTAGGELEIAPRAQAKAGTSELDLAWFERRLQAGGVAFLSLEPSNNAIAGWPLGLEHLASLRALCDRHGARILLDATRLLSNCLAVRAAGQTLAQAAHAFTSLADAFWVSCAKELLVPTGALAAVRTLELERKLYAYSFREGTPFEPLDGRARLARGMALVQEDEEILAGRRRQLLLLGEALREAGVPFVEPVGGHAVFVPFGADLLGTDPLRPRAVEALLYRLGGVRALLHPYPMLGGAHLRLAVTVGRFRDEELQRAAAAVATTRRRIAEAPALVDDPHDESGSELFRGYARA